MSPEQFCYWLQGFAELTGDEPPTTIQWRIIKDHLDLVFNKVTPDRKKVLTEEKKVPTLEELMRQEICSPNPFDRPDVYCAPEVVDEFKVTIPKNPRIC